MFNSCGRSLSLGLAGNGQEELEFGRKLVFGVQSVREIDSPDSAVSVDLDSEGLYVVGTIGSSGEIRQVELNLIPSLVKSHRHCADEWLDSGGALVVGGSESSSHTLVIEHLDLESEVLFEVLDDHDQERQLDSKRLLGVERSVDVVGGHVSSHDLENGGLNIGVGDSLDVAVSDLFVPNLQRLGSIKIDC